MVGNDKSEATKIDTISICSLHKQTVQLPQLSIRKHKKEIFTKLNLGSIRPQFYSNIFIPMNCNFSIGLSRNNVNCPNTTFPYYLLLTCR